MTGTLPYIQELALLIESAWTTAKRNGDDFSNVATQTLCDFSPLGRMRDADIIEWSTSSRVLPPQAKLDDSFGQPSLTLYSNDDFRIDALFWVTATTGIHQHSFSGAFAVLKGSSIHCVYHFLNNGDNNRRLRFGAIELASCEMLKAGDVRAIPNGPNLIHSVFHLHAPTVTLVVRTRGDLNAEPEYVYKPPYLALDPNVATVEEAKKLEIVDLLVRIRSPMLVRITKNIIENGDIATTFHVLRNVARTAGQRDCLLEIEEIARGRFSANHCEKIFATIREETRRLQVASLRTHLDKIEHRFLLAGLMNFPNPGPFVRLVESAYPQADPLDRIATWIIELSDTQPIGIEFDPSIETLLGHCLRYGSQKTIIRNLIDEFGAESILAEKENIAEGCRRIMSNHFLQPLFRVKSWESR